MHWRAYRFVSLEYHHTSALVAGGEQIPSLIELNRRDDVRCSTGRPATKYHISLAPSTVRLMHWERKVAERHIPPIQRPVRTHLR